MVKSTLILASCCFLGLWGIGITVPPLTHATEGRGSAPHIDLAFEVLPADNFDSLLSRATGNFGLGKLGAYRLSGDFELAHRATTGSGLFPEDLYRLGLKLGAGNRLWRFSLGLASESDEPFDSSDEISLQASASREVARWERSSLHLGLFYTTRFDYPLPTLVYTFADRDLFFMVGLPVASVSWRIDERTTLKGSYVPVRRAKIALERTLSPTWSMALEWAIDEESYLVAGRRDKDDSLVLETRTVKVRAEKRIALLTLSAYGGFSFDGSFFREEGFGDREDKVEFDDAWVAGANVRFAF